MRALLVGDILALAKAVAGRDGAMTLALRLCAEAHAAHAYTKRFRRIHPHWGNGSLMSRAYAEAGGMQSDWSDAGLAALGVAVAAVQLWRAERLDCPLAGLYGRRTLPQAETDHGRNPAQTQHHRPGLGAPLFRGA